MMDEPLDIRSDAQRTGEALERTRGQLDEATRAARTFGTTLADALKSGMLEGRRFDDILKGLGQRLLRFTTDLAFRQLGSSIATGMKGILTGLTSAIGGGGFVPKPELDLPDLLGGNLRPFAKGGVVGGPTLFPLRGGLGLMGEAGAEAILPLARGADGRLGIRAAETEIAAPVSVVVNVTTPDAASFRRSESYVSAVLARAVARGRRTL